MGKFIDLTGQKIGRLLVIKRVDNVIQPNKKSVVRYLCKCDCGNEIIVRRDSLGRNTFSCGCIKKESDLKGNPKHNLCHTRIYKIWSEMKSRCYNFNDRAYKYYGERGIIIYNEWLNKENGFINFYNWGMENGYEDTLTIDRIDVNGNYEPNNCRWVTMETQANNKRNNKIIEFNGEKDTLSNMCKKYNLDYRLIQLRLRRNWSIERAFLEPINIKHRGRWGK